MLGSGILPSEEPCESTPAHFHTISVSRAKPVAKHYTNTGGESRKRPKC